MQNNERFAYIHSFTNGPFGEKILAMQADTCIKLYSNNLEFNGKNVDTIEEQGDGYIRYSNGIQICWGGNKTYADGNASNQVVTFPKSFSSSNSNLHVICQSTNPYVNGIMYGWVNTQGFTVTSKGEYTFSYIAIGRWK